MDFSIRNTEKKMLFQVHIHLNTCLFFNSNLASYYHLLYSIIFLFANGDLCLINGAYESYCKKACELVVNHIRKISFDDIWLHLEEMLAKRPFLFSMDVPRLHKHETVKVLIRPLLMQIRHRMLAYERTLSVKWHVTTNLRRSCSCESLDKLVVQGIRAYLLIVKSSYLDNIWPFTNL